MTTRPMVSAIITTYNSAGTLERLLVSLKKQTYKNLEIVVVDNNSKDDTATISKKYTKLVFNKGPERSAQRNLGVEKAKGEYVVILDSDMELTPEVIEDCVKTAQKGNLQVLIIPEKTIGEGFIPKIRKFEREMYMGDLSIEVARFFSRRIFLEFHGYDLELTGPEDYDLPYRISKKHKIGRSYEYIYHHESSLSLSRLLAKRYYYASQGAKYAQKHPELIKTQGNFLFRKAFFRNHRKFFMHPITGLLFIAIKILETIWAIAGYISAVGIVGFIKTLYRMFLI